MDERELDCTDGPPLIGWRLFRVRHGGSGPMLAAPLIHDPDFELFPSIEIAATCYDHDHPAPAPSCRCGLYVAIEGTLDSLAGYLLDSAHDMIPSCTPRSLAGAACSSTSAACAQSASRSLRSPHRRRRGPIQGRTPRLWLP